MTLEQQFFYNLSRGRLTAVKKALLQTPSLATTRRGDYFPLQMVCRSRRGLPLLGVLLEAGADPNAVASGRYPHRLHTPLRLAFDHAPELVGPLLAAGAEPLPAPVCRTGQNLMKYHRSDLQWAAHQALEWVPLFLSKGLPADTSRHPWKDCPLQVALAIAQKEAWKKNWEQFGVALAAVTALVDALGVSWVKDQRVAWGGGHHRPYLHMLWSLRWMPGVLDRSEDLARIDALLDRFDLDTTRCSTGRSFLVALAMLSRGRRLGDGLSSREWQAHTQHVLDRFGVAALSPLAQGDGLELLRFHLPLEGGWPRQDLAAIVAENLRRAHWWIDVLGVRLGAVDADGNGLAHHWGQGKGSVWLAEPVVADAAVGLGMEWVSPNAEGKTAQQWARIMAGRAQVSPEDQALRAGVLTTQLPRPALGRSRDRF